MKRIATGTLVAGLLLVGCGGGSNNGTSGTTLPPSIAAGALTSTQCTSAGTALSAAAAAVPQALTGNAGDIQQSIDQLQAVADAAPAEIKADLQTVIDGYTQVAQILADANLQPGQVPSADTIQRLTDAGQALDTDAFKAASDRVSTWFQTQCGK